MYRNRVWIHGSSQVRFARLPRALLGLVLWGTLSATAWSAVVDHYVDPAAGLNTNAGTSAGAPYQTLAKAVTVAASGSHIYLIRGGVARESNVTIPSGVT